MAQGKFKGLAAKKQVGQQFTARKNKPEKKKMRNEQLHKLKKIINKTGYKRIESEMKGVAFECSQLQFKQKKSNGEGDPNKMPPPSKK